MDTVIADADNDMDWNVYQWVCHEIRIHQVQSSTFLDLIGRPHHPSRGSCQHLCAQGPKPLDAFCSFFVALTLFENQSHSDLVSSGWPRHLFLRNWWLTADDASSVKILSLQKIPLIGGLQDVYRNLLITEKGFWSVCKNIQKITLRTFSTKTICFLFCFKMGVLWNFNTPSPIILG